ncbi:MAG: amidohydrolase family protein [Myxococcota bacterium]
MRSLRALVGAFLLGLLAAPALAGDIVVEADLLHTEGPRGTLEDGVVLVRDGRIAEVGSRGRVEIPPDATRLWAAVVTPGLIDTHSVAGLAGLYNVPADQDVNEATGPNQAALRAIDGFNPREPLLRWLLEHGVTVVQSGPGEANPIGGQAGIFKTHGESVAEMTLRFPSALVMTLGEPPKATYGAKKQRPSTRMGTAAVIRSALGEAQEYARKRDAPAKQDAEPPPRDLGKEALALALARRIPVIATARREDDIGTALRIAEEFDLDLQLADAVEAYLAADRIAEAGVPVHVGPVMERIGSLETMNLTLENAAILAGRGIPITFQSGFEGYVPRTHVVLFEAAVAGAWGLGFERALSALTLDAAQRLGIDDRVGSLEPGKHADLVLFDGDPFEYTTHIQAVLVDGEIVHQRPTQ